jgi:putative hydrolase of the HAD superfamily
MAARTHLFTDADNTLWDTNGVFAEAQLAMLRDVEMATGLAAPEAEDRGLEFLRRIDQRIAAAHPERLRYPPALLARGLLFALAGDGADEAADRATREDVAIPGGDGTIRRFTERLSSVPCLRSGVKEGLTIIANAGVPIFVVTEERFEWCQQLLDAHGLSPLVAEVISIRKTVHAFRELRRMAGKGSALMVGDQLDRDIRCANEAGFETFFFPSGFAPYWNRDVAHVPDHEIACFDEIVPFVLGGIARWRRKDG